MARASDGTILLGISAPCDDCQPDIAESASIVSFRPDGSDLRVYASDIRAPVGLAFYPGTYLLFATMNQPDKLGDATPGDWLSVVRDGQDWHFPECYGQGGTVCADQPAPLAVLDTHAAVSGVAIVTGSLGPVVGTAAVVAEWAQSKLVSVALDQDDPTATSTARTLVTGLDNPVPVVAGPDDALYVGDWTSGTIYRIDSAGA
jgi:glucose/arabinose dehydrogenase